MCVRGRGQAAAAVNLTEVVAGAGAGVESRLTENRRWRMSDGSEGDVRHAYGQRPDAEVVEVGLLIASCASVSGTANALVSPSLLKHLASNWRSAAADHHAR